MNEDLLTLFRKTGALRIIDANRNKPVPFPLVPVSIDEIVDDFRTPYTRWTSGQKTPGVEINASIFLNLLRGDCRSRFSPGKERWLLILTGLSPGNTQRGPLTGTHSGG